MAFAALTIDINAKLANLEAGLKRAEGALTGFGAKVDAFGAAFTKAFVVAGASAAFIAIERGISRTVEQMAALDDAAESTGASVESLSSLLNTLSPTGVGLDQITDAMGKLTRAMSNADEESSKAGEAFEALGVATRDASGNLRSTDQVLEDIARALAQYADGANKVAIVQAIFGKSGAALLPMLKDLASRQREAATVTDEQAQAAEKLQNSWRELGVAADKLVQKLSGPIVTALADIVQRFNDARTAGLGFFDALQGSTLPDSRVSDEIDKQRKAIEGLNQARAAEIETRRKNANLQDDGTLASIDAEIAVRQRAIEFLQNRANKLDRPRLEDLASSDPELARLLRGRQAGQAPALSGGGKTSTPRAARPEPEKVDEFARAVDDRLSQSLDKARVDAEVFAETLARLDTLFASGLISAEDYDRAIATLARTSAVAGRDGVGELDRKLEQQAEQWRDVIDPMRKYIRQLEEIRELVKAGKLTPEQGITAEFDVQNRLQNSLDPVTDSARQAADAARDLGLTFSSAFEDAVLGAGKFSDVLEGLAQDVLRIFLRQQITQPLANLVSSGASSLFGGSTLFESIFGAVPKRELGGRLGAGQAAIVGERGRELFIPDTSGTVVPNGRFGGATVVQNINVTGEVGRMDIANAVAIATSMAKREILDSMGRRGAFARA